MAFTILSGPGYLPIVGLKIMTALAIGLPSAAVLASQQAKQLEIDVQILRENKPAEGATVWIEERKYQAGEEKVARKIGPLIVPESGCVHFSLTPNSGYYALFARNDRDEMGQGSFYQSKNTFIENSYINNRITLTLKKARQIKGQLFFENQPLENAECHLSSLSSRIEIRSPYLSNYDQTSLIDRSKRFPRTVKTDKEGRFVLSGVPEGTDAQVKIDMGGLGSGNIHVASGKSIEAELRPGGNLALSIEGETKPISLKGVQFLYDEPSPVKTPQGRGIVYLTPGKSGFADDMIVPGERGCAAGSYRLYTPVDPGLPYHFGLPQKIKIEAGITTRLVLSKVPVAGCSGRIVDAKTGKGIPNLNLVLEGGPVQKDMAAKILSAYTRESFPGETDAQGHYEIVCRGNYEYTLIIGKYSYNDTDYEFPDADPQTRMLTAPHVAIGDGEKARMPEIALIPSRAVTATVKDESGKPVDGPFEVYCLTRRHAQPKAPQFEKGKFTLSQLKPDMPLKFLVRKGKAVNVVKALPVAKLDQPLEFTISEKNQVTCTGRVVDANRQPIARAVVEVLWNPEAQDESNRNKKELGNLIERVEALETDDQGRFSAQGLWPNERFSLRVSRLGYKPKSSRPSLSRLGRTITGQAAASGETIDFGDMVLTEVTSNE